MIGLVPILTVNDVEDAYATFASVLQSLYNEHCPLKTVRIKRLDAENPYISTDLKKLIKEKHKVQKLYNKFPVTYGERYRQIRNRVNSAVSRAKSAY